MNQRENQFTKNTKNLRKKEEHIRGVNKDVIVVWCGLIGFALLFHCGYKYKKPLLICNYIHKTLHFSTLTV